MGLFSMMLMSNALKGKYGHSNKEVKKNNKNENTFPRPVKRIEREDIGNGLFREKIYKDNVLYCDKIVDSNGNHAGECITYDKFNESYLLKTYNRMGELDGPYREVFHHRVIMEGNFVKGKKEGRWISGKSSGYYTEENYKANKLDGESTTYAVKYGKVEKNEAKDLSFVPPFEEKILQSKSHYNVGKLDGILEIYARIPRFDSKDVYLSEKHIYKENAWISSETYYENGNLKYRQEGDECISYYPNGVIKEEFKKASKGYSSLKKYNEQGNLIEEHLTNGIICRYDNQGNIISRIFKKNQKEYDFLRTGADNLISDNKLIKQQDKKERRKTLKLLLKAGKQGDRTAVSAILRAFHKSGNRPTALDLSRTPKTLPKKSVNKSFWKQLFKKSR